MDHVTCLKQSLQGSFGQEARFEACYLLFASIALLAPVLLVIGESARCIASLGG